MISRLVACAAIVFSLPKPAPIDEERMLDAIKDVENWDGRTPGRAGEWGAFQITPGVWRSYSRRNQRWVTPQQERVVARLHLHWIREQLREHSLPETPWFIAAAWGAGMGAVTRRAVSPAKADYADRTQALYEAATRRSLALTSG